MRNERAQRRERQGTMNAGIQQADQSGKKVIEAKHISVRFGDKLVIDDFSTLILRGDRIGIIGPNGAGKSTLIQVLLGQRNPDQGQVKLGTNVEVAYFDQLRAQLDEELSVRENVGQGSDRVLVNGEPKHIMGYLQDFLFSPERANTPVKALSGGERNRLLLARLFTRPANLLVMDEPTNDLDIETLELLEDLLTRYQGTLLLVSHDRAFLNNIVTSTIVFEGEGKLAEYVGGYDDWLRQRPAPVPTAPQVAPPPPAPAPPRSTPDPKPKKLSYKDQRELEALPLRIEQLEQQLDSLHQQLADPALYQQTPTQITEVKQAAAKLETELEQAFARWEQLESRRNSSI